MTSGDRGVVIVCDAGGYNLTGSTCVLLAAPGVGPNAVGNPLTLTPVVIAANGLTASYTTTGEDFLLGGPWQASLEVQTLGGSKFTSPPATFYVYPLP